jgi:cytochrome P450
VWRRLRDGQPLYRNDELDFWALSRYADVEAAHRNPAVYISSHGTVLELMGPEPLPTGQMIFLDPPRHTILRALVSRAFTPRRVSQLEDRIRGICADLLDPHIGSTGFDYVQDFGALLPSMVISALIGVPDEDREAVRHHIDQVFHIEPGVGMINDVSFMAQVSLHEYFMGLIARRRANPADDMVTGLTQAEITTEDGEIRRLSDEEAVDFTNLLVSAGTETVARLLGWAGVTLAANPDQRAALAADASLLPNAIEELLRFEAPSPVQGRFTTADVELHGTTVPAGSKLLLTAPAKTIAYGIPTVRHQRRFDTTCRSVTASTSASAPRSRLESRIALERRSSASRVGCRHRSRQATAHQHGAGYASCRSSRALTLGKVVVVTGAGNGIGQRTPGIRGEGAAWSSRHRCHRARPQPRSSRRGPRHRAHRRQRRNLGGRADGAPRSRWHRRARQQRRSAPGPLQRATTLPVEWRRILDVNVVGGCCAPVRRGVDGRGGGGVVLNRCRWRQICRRGAWRSKVALNGLTMCRRRAAVDGTRASASPRHGRARGARPPRARAQDLVIRMQLGKRFGEVGDLVGVVLFSGREAALITGQTFLVDGGAVPQL